MRLDEDVWHYVRPNEAAIYPRRIVCLDSEACIDPHETGERHSFMLAAASYDRINRRSLDSDATEWLETDNATDLWEWIVSHSRKRERLTVWAHNLGYDLRLTRGLTILPSLGWRMAFLAVDGRRCFARFTKDTATLTLVDSASFLPRSLDYLGQELGHRKLPLPEQGEAADKWFARCLRDVEILRSLVLHLLKWLETNDCGNWKPTGPAQSWATFRHRFMDSRSILVHRDAEALEAERVAAWTGRTEVWKHGEYSYPLQEWDYRLAYASIAAETRLPSRYLGARSATNQTIFPAGRNGYATLYDCTIETETPCLPARLDGRVVWPSGTFHSTVWDVEAMEALRFGARLTVHRSWQYRTSYCLQRWGNWIIDQLTNPERPADPIIRVMLKHWARALIGRFSMRYPEWEQVGKGSDEDLLYFPCYDLQSGDESQWLQLGHDWYSANGKHDGRDTVPAITSYIAAVQRVKLWQAIQAAGESEVFYCDTDSLIVTPTGGRGLDELRKQSQHANLMRKAEYQSATFHAPRAMILDGEPRIAGLPRQAQQTGRRSYKLSAWQSLSDSISSGDAATIRVRERAFTIPTKDTRRRHLPHGHTEPYRIS